MMTIADIVFLILSIGPISVESDLCKKMDSNIIPAYYFDIGGLDCNTVYLSRKQIPLTYFQETNVRCQRKPIPFRWNAKSMAIVTKKGNSYIFNIVPAVALLDNQKNKNGVVTVNLRDHRTQKYWWHRSGHQSLATCHRVSNVFLYCFDFDGSDVIQTMLHLEPFSRTVTTKNQIKWTFEFKIDSIASYSTPKKENHLLIKHPLNWIYNVNLDELSKNKEQKWIVYNIEDWQKSSNLSKAELVFADDNMLETRRCKRDGSCSYDFHFPRQITTPQSFCLYEKKTNFLQGIIIDRVKPPPITPPSTSSVDEGHGEIKESEEWMYYQYIPIQILALITFIYLCFFFFYAFKPNPNSNLVELHAMMEEEYSRLSLLTDEVVKRMIAERQRPASLILKRQPELAPVPTDSTEMICCCGTTCESWLCPHCRIPEENLAGSLKRTFSLPPSKRKSAELYATDKWRTDSSRKRTKSVSRTIVPKQTFNTNAKSTATRSINPQDAKTGKRLRPMTAAPIKRGYPEREARALPVRLWKGGSSEMRRLTPERVMKRVSSEIRRATPERVRKRGSSELRRPPPEKHKAQAGSLRANRPAMVQMGDHI